MLRNAALWWVDGRLRVGSCLQLLDRGIVILEIGVLEEDQVVVPMCLYAIFTESVSTLVAGTLDFLTLVPWLLAVGNSLA